MRALADALDVALTVGTEGDVARAIQELTEPGPFLAFSNGDAGVNNFLLADGADGKLIDFEFGGSRHALSDVACLCDSIPEVADDRRYGMASARPPSPARCSAWPGSTGSTVVRRGTTAASRWWRRSRRPRPRRPASAFTPTSPAGLA